MPSRYVRDGLLRSELFNTLEFIEQSIYVRLLLIVDDFGCFDGREEIIASQACPLWAGGDGMEAVPPALSTMHRLGMILRYVNAGKPFIAITQWGGEYREFRKFPAPPINNDLATVNGKALKVRPKYGRDISWANPSGYDDVSVLLDLEGRVAVPQPPEWRNTNDWSPMTMRRSHSAPVTVTPPAVTTTQSLEPVRSDCVPREGEGVVIRDRVGVGGVVGLVTGTQSLQTADAGNGEAIRWEENGFKGLTEGQRLRWQEMFDSVSIPDQVSRAEAWLQANPEERLALERNGANYHAFLVRWLLREVRSSTPREVARHDS